MSKKTSPIDNVHGKQELSAYDQDQDLGLRPDRMSRGAKAGIAAGAVVLASIVGLAHATHDAKPSVTEGHVAFHPDPKAEDQFVHRIIQPGETAWNVAKDYAFDQEHLGEIRDDIKKQTHNGVLLPAQEVTIPNVHVQQIPTPDQQVQGTSSTATTR